MWKKQNNRFIRQKQSVPGMGFAFMEAFMDSVKVELHIGTRITMEKEIGKVEDE